MGLRWEDVGFGVLLGYVDGDDAPPDGSHVGRVREVRNRSGVFEAHYDPEGLLRHAGRLFGPPTDDRYRLAETWAWPPAAMAAVDRRHDELARLREG